MKNLHKNHKNLRFIGDALTNNFRSDLKDEILQFCRSLKISNANRIMSFETQTHEICRKEVSIQNSPVLRLRPSFSGERKRLHEQSLYSKWSLWLGLGDGGDGVSHLPLAWLETRRKEREKKRKLWERERWSELVGESVSDGKRGEEALFLSQLSLVKVWPKSKNKIN